MANTSANEGESSGSLSVLPKACENCRIRKIRCNRAIPCSNCETSGIVCRPASKTTEHRSRVLLSQNYEKQIEQINERLGNIQEALHNLHLDKPAVSPDALTEAATSSAPTSSTEAASRSRIATPAAFEGASSFTSQAILASHAVQSSFGTMSGSADFDDALTSLRALDKDKAPGIAGIRQDMRLGDSSAPRHMPDLQMLPAPFVLNLLQEFKNRSAALFLAYAFRDHRQLERLCQQVYFPTQPVTLASLTLMHGMLLYMMKELLYEGSYGLCKDYDLRTYHDQSEKNFHRGVETYELFAHPSLDSAKCLMLAMLKAQEEGKPLLTWTFLSTGVRQVISLGYHREASLKHDSLELAEDKRQVFWTFYMVDKTLALNLGRTPNIQDYDIDVRHFTCSTDPGVRPWDRAALAMVEIAQLQGLIYERLYSLRALHSSPVTKAQIISDLSPRLEKWHREWSQEVNVEHAHLPTFFFLIYGAFDVVYYSVVTTMHRAATPSNDSVEITSACYEAAKKSLKAHLHFFPAFKSYGDAEILASYVAWILLYASWTPLIVVFLHAIASASNEDVELLEAAEISLEPIKNVNKQSEQVYKLSKTFHKLAKAFVARNSTFVGTYNQQEDMVVMPQSDAQGVVHEQVYVPASTMQYPAQIAGPEYPVPSFDSTEMDGMSMFFGNWFGGNRPVSQLWSVDFTESQLG